MEFKTGQKITGAQSLIASLETEGVRHIFGIPGGTILPAYDPLLDSSIRHILCRHEQGAAHAADGYAQATGQAGVCFATSGPGATNLVTGLASAWMDSVPMVAVTGQVNTFAIGGDAFQEADVTGITIPVTKHNWLVMEPHDIPKVIHEAFHIATTGRPGPVVVDIPKDVLQATTEWWYPDSLDLPGYRPRTFGDPREVRRAAEMILQARKPVVYAGGGIVKSFASDELREFCELTGIPTVTTLMCRGAISDDHELNLGMPGMHGNYTAVTSMQEADLLIALGTRFDDRVTGKLATFAQNAKIIHVDIDPSEIGKNRHPDIGIVGNAKHTVSKLDVQEVDTVPGRVDVRRAAEDVIHDIANGTLVNVETNDGVIASADPEHVVRMLQNYLRNALIYGEPPYAIEIEGGTEWVAVRVRDHGSGVPAEFVPKLFGKFARVDKKKSKAVQGTGLGLSIVQGLAHANGGVAWYEPNHPQGACFCFRVPAAAQSAGAEEPYAHAN